MKTRIVGFIILMLAPQLIFGQLESWDNLGKLRGGEKIDVIDMKLKSFQGNFISYSQEMVSLRVDRDDISISRIDVFRVTYREQSHRLRNAFIGLGLGAAAGAGIGAAITASLADNSEVQYGAGLGALLGMTAGTALGAVLPSAVTLYRVPGTSRKQP